MRDSYENVPNECAIRSGLSTSTKQKSLALAPVLKPEIFAFRALPGSSAPLGYGGTHVHRVEGDAHQAARGVRGHRQSC
jgi:hypothetical protein